MSGFQPGDFTPALGDCGPYVVVLATSRHKRTYERAAAEQDLRVQLINEGWEIERFRTMRWYSHTANVDAWSCFGDWCTVGSFCSGGDGQAWVEILYVDAVEVMQP